MLELKFKHRGYNRLVEIQGDTFQEMYYELNQMLNSMEPTFQEDRFIEDLEQFDNEYYKKLFEQDPERANEYWELMKEFICEGNYKDFIDDIFYGQDIKDYLIQYHNVYYFDEIVEYYNLKYSYKDLDRMNKKLLSTGKVKEDFNGRLYTEDIKLYEQLEIELEDN